MALLLRPKCEAMKAVRIVAILAMLFAAAVALIGG